MENVHDCKLAHVHDCKPAYLYFEAINRNDMDYIKNNVLSVKNNDYIFYYALYNGNINIITFLQNDFCFDKKKICNYAAWGGNIDILKYAHLQLEGKIMYSTLVHSTIHNSIECLKYCLLHYKFTSYNTINSELVRFCACHHSYDCLRYILNNTEEFDCKILAILNMNCASPNKSKEIKQNEIEKLGTKEIEIRNKKKQLEKETKKMVLELSERYPNIVDYNEYCGLPTNYLDILMYNINNYCIKKICNKYEDTSDCDE